MRKPEKLSLKDSEILSIILLRKGNLSYRKIAKIYGIKHHAAYYHCLKFSEKKNLDIHPVDYFVAKKVLEDNVLGDHFIFKENILVKDFSKKTEEEKINFINNILNKK